MTRPKHPSALRGKASILKEEDVRRLRELAEVGLLNTAEAARAHGVGVETIRRAVRGDTFSNLSRPASISDEQLAADAAASAARMVAMITAAKAQKAAGPAIVQELAALDEVSVETKARAFGASIKTTVIQPVVEEGEHDAGYD